MILAKTRERARMQTYIETYRRYRLFRHTCVLIEPEGADAFTEGEISALFCGYETTRGQNCGIERRSSTEARNESYNQ